MTVLKFIVATSAILAMNACGSVSTHDDKVEELTANLTNEEVQALIKRCSRELKDRLPIGFSDHCYVHKNRRRDVRVYRPKSNRGQNTPAALVFVLHGGGGSGEQVSDNSKSPLAVFNQVAEEKNLIVVYPTATKDNTGKNGWNDCRSDDTSKNGVDDSSFLASLIQEMSGNYGLSRNQVFVSGHSNGAMMSFRMALEHSDLIGAIATSAGNIAKNPIAGACSDGPKNPLPVLMTHGSEDRFVPPEGGCVANLRGKRKCERGYVASAKETVDFWLRMNGHANSTPASRTVELDKRDGGTAIESKFSSGSAPVTAWMLNGAGHPVPSTTVKVRPFIVGKQNRDIEFAREAWAFFESILP